MAYQEKDFQSLFGKRNKIFGVFELKLEKGKSFRFDRVAEHQQSALLKASKTGIYHKISDSLPIFGGNKHMRFTSKKPFDCINVKGDAYVVIMFYEPRNKKRVLYLLIDDFLSAQRSTERKSMREDELAQFALYDENWIKSI